MLRGLGRALGAAVVFAMLAGDARAQFGYGYYPYGYGGSGWGGWEGGSTVQGDIARGLGYFNIGAGIYNEKTAIANAIDADTLGRWNQYLYLSQQEANRREYLRLARRQARDSASGEQILKRLRENPEDRDVVNGGALNVILDQLSDPRIHSSALRMAGTSVKGSVVRNIPFVHASEAVTISLNRLTTEDGWPAALRDEFFAPERDAYQRLISQALDEDEKGEIQPQTTAQIRDVLARLREKLKMALPQDPPVRIEAENYLKTLIGMARMLDQPETGKVLAELDSIKSTSLGNMLAFMHTFNLRFGPAQNDSQRVIYRELYPLMASSRDRILSDAGIKKTASTVAATKVEKPIDFFRAMHLDHVEGRPGDGGDEK